MTPFNLALFPLNTVLFPGMPLQLHIFEERYKQMINRCIQQGQPFGVVLIRKGVEAHGPLAEPYAIGTMARISQVQKLSQGRMNILSVGAERFRVVEFDYASRPYLVGSVELFPLQDQERVLQPAGAQLRMLLKEYLENLARLSERDEQIRLRWNALEELTDPYLVLDRQERIVDANQAALQLIGAPRQAANEAISTIANNPRTTMIWPILSSEDTDLVMVSFNVKLAMAAAISRLPRILEWECKSLSWNERSNPFRRHRRSGGGRQEH
jgi:Lon protease-like protein